MWWRRSRTVPISTWTPIRPLTKPPRHALAWRRPSRSRRERSEQVRGRRSQAEGDLAPQLGHPVPVEKGVTLEHLDITLNALQRDGQEVGRPAGRIHQMIDQIPA